MIALLLLALAPLVGGRRPRRLEKLASDYDSLVSAVAHDETTSTVRVKLADSATPVPLEHAVGGAPRRTFRPAGVHEAQHVAAGLDRWWSFTFPDAARALEALEAMLDDELLGRVLRQRVVVLQEEQEDVRHLREQEAEEELQAQGRGRRARSRRLSRDVRRLRRRRRGGRRRVPGLVELVLQKIQERVRLGEQEVQELQKEGRVQGQGPRSLSRDVRRVRRLTTAGVVGGHNDPIVRERQA